MMGQMISSPEHPTAVQNPTNIREPPRPTRVTTATPYAYNGNRTPSSTGQVPPQHGSNQHYHHPQHDQDMHNWRQPRNNNYGQNPKMTLYDGKVPWRAYEMKLEHMANQYNW